METLNLDLLKSIPIPADIREGALALEGRVEGLRKKTIACYVAAGIGAILGLTAYGLSVWFSPDIYISSAHIPDELLKVFSGSVAYGGSFSLSPQVAIAVFAPYLQFFGLGALVVGMGIAIVRCTIGPLMVCLPVAMGPMIITSLLGDVTQSTAISEKTQFIQMVNTGDVSGVDQTFKVHKLSGSLGDYVLAQTMLIRKKGEVGDNKKAKVFDDARFKDLVLRLDQKAQDISAVISPGVLMALEIQALGKTQSAIARAHEKKELAKVSLVNTLERVIKYLSFALITLGVILLAFKTVMQRRLINIAGLLKQHHAGKVDPYFRKTK
jgi:hypothetical protein